MRAMASPSHGSSNTDPIPAMSLLRALYADAVVGHVVQETFPGVGHVVQETFPGSLLRDAVVGHVVQETFPGGITCHDVS